MFERFSERARKVMSLARQQAQRMNSDDIGAAHILLGIIQEANGSACMVLKGLKVDLDDLRQYTEKLMMPHTTPSGMLGQMPFSARAKRSIQLAGQASTLMKHDVIGTEHLLLGLLMENESVAAQVLITRGVTLQGLRDAVAAVEREE